MASRKSDWPMGRDRSKAAKARPNRHECHFRGTRERRVYINAACVFRHSGALNTVAPERYQLIHTCVVPEETNNNN